MEKSKNSIARKKYWESITPDQRKAHASKMATDRWSKLSTEQRTEINRKSALKRWHPELSTD